MVVYAVSTFGISYLLVSLLVRMPTLKTHFKISVYTNHYYRGQFIDL